MDLANLADHSPEELHALLRDLAARAAAAEASRAAAEASRAAAEASRVETEARLSAEQARSQALQEQLEAADQTVTVLLRRVATLTQQLAKLRGRPEQLAVQLELAAVQRQLSDLNRDTFGARSERRGRPEGAPPKAKPEKKPQTGHGPTQQERLPRTEQHHLLDVPDQQCPNCTDRTLRPWEGRTDDSEEVTVVERTYQIVVHRRQVYRCGGCGHLETALGPRRFVPGGRYSPEFAVSVAVDKYRDAIPLARQGQRMAEQGLEVTTSTLWDQTSELYPLLLPSYLALQKRILTSDLVHADETPWRLMKKGGSKRWCRRAGPVVGSPTAPAPSSSWPLPAAPPPLASCSAITTAS